jgi:hypothetical protein
MYYFLKRPKHYYEAELENKINKDTEQLKQSMYVHIICVQNIDMI